MKLACSTAWWGLRRITMICNWTNSEEHWTGGGRSSFTCNCLGTWAYVSVRFISHHRLCLYRLFLGDRIPDLLFIRLSLSNPWKPSSVTGYAILHTAEPFVWVTGWTQCSRIRILCFFSDFKKTWLFTFFWNDVSKSRKKSLATV